MCLVDYIEMRETEMSLTNLVSRLREHARMHDDLAAHSDEQAQWALDLREAADLLEQRAAAEPRAPRTLTEMSQQVLPQVTRAEALLSELPTAELYNRVGQLLAGWKQGCAPGEWSDFDESVLQAWQSWRVMQMRRHQNDLPSACGERFGNGAHHECCREPNHPGKCRCSCGAENRQAEPTAPRELYKCPRCGAVEQGGAVFHRPACSLIV